MRLGAQPNHIKPQKMSLLRLACQLQPEIYIIVNHHSTPNATTAFSNSCAIWTRISYTILRKRVDPVLVQRARKTLAKTLEDRRQSVEEDVVFVNIFKKFEVWPDECKTLLAEIRVSGNCFTP